MEVEIFTLCDAATESQGKLSILGTFDTIFANRVPAIHPQCAVVVRLRFSRIETGDHTFVLHLVDEDGNAVIPPLQGKLGVNFKLNDHFATANMILNIQNLKLEKYGEYSLDLAVNGRELASLPLLLRQPPT